MKSLLIPSSFVLLLLLSPAKFAYGTDFSCPFGTNGACLDFGDKVCSRSAKCVDDDAACFSAYTCGFGNEFVCKSEYEDLVNEYDDLVRRHNDLVDELARLQRKQSDVESCISYSSSLDEAQNCIW